MSMPRTFEALVKEVKAYLVGNGAPEVVNVVESDRKTVLSLSHCPFRGPAHLDGGPGVLVWKSGQHRL